MPERFVEDILRAEYFKLLPEIRRVTWQLETEIRYHTSSIRHKLRQYEQLLIRSRVKDCESAIKALQRRQEGRVFDPDRSYSLTSLPDLAGVRVLIFPGSKLKAAHPLLRKSYSDWEADPVPDGAGGLLAHKYNGYCHDISSTIRAEYQIVPMLVGLFWEVEHSAMYKPDPALMGIGKSPEMNQLKAEVESFAAV